MHLTPGQVVLREFGAKLAAEVCTVDPSAVWRWSQKKPTGTGGTVPSKHHGALMQAARERGLTLTADDLVTGRNVEPEAA